MGTRYSLVALESLILSSEKIDIFYLIICLVSWPLFSKNSPVSKSEILFDFTFKLVHLVLNDTNLTKMSFGFYTERGIYWYHIIN